MSEKNNNIRLFAYNSLTSERLDDEDYLKEIYSQYWAKLFVYAFNILKERELCEDIIQDVFVDLWTKRKDIEINNVKAYLYQSVKYQIFNQFRKSNYKKQLFDNFDLINTEFQLEEIYEGKEYRENIAEAISNLPQQRKIIFQMSRHQGLSNKEISRSLNISIQTVKNQISASLKFIRKSLNKIYFFFS